MSRIDVICKYCGKNKNIMLSRYKANKTKDFFCTYDCCRKYRKNRRAYEPGLFRKESLYWPEHDLSNAGGWVSLVKLERWQKNNYDPRWVPILKPLRGPRLLLGEFGTPSKVKSGHIRYRSGCFPLAFEHRIVYWQETDYDEKVLELLKSRKATVHHRNGIRDDNRPENLDLRLKHPHGNNADDWVHILSLSEEGRQKMRTALIDE